MTDSGDCNGSAANSAEESSLAAPVEGNTAKNAEIKNENKKAEVEKIPVSEVNMETNGDASNHVSTPVSSVISVEAKEKNLSKLGVESSLKIASEASEITKLLASDSGQNSNRRASAISTEAKSPLTRSNSGNEEILTIDEEPSVSEPKADISKPVLTKPVLKPISVDTSSTSSSSSVNTRNSSSRGGGSLKTGPKSAPSETLAASRSKRARVPVRHFEFEDLEEAEPDVIPQPAQPSAKSAPAKTRPKKSPTASSSNAKETLFDKGDYCTVRSDLQGENFYLCLLCQNVYPNTKSNVSIRWLEIEKSPNQYKWSFPDRIDKGCVLTNVNVDSLGKDRIILPNSEIMRSIYVLKKSIQSEKGEKVSLELPPQPSGEAKEEVPDMKPTANEKRASAKNQTAQKTPAPLKRNRERSLSSVESSEQFSDASDDYVAPKAKTRGGSAKSSGGGGKRGRPTRNQTAVADRQKVKGLQLDVDEEFSPSVERKTRGGACRSTPTKAQSPGSSGQELEKTLSPIKSPIRSARENFAARIKVNPNDLFYDSKYVFDVGDSNFKAKQLIRLVSFGDMDVLKKFLADPKIDSACCGRSKDCREGPFETAALNDDVTSLVLLMDKNAEINKTKPWKSCLLDDDDLLSEDLFLKQRQFPSDSFFEDLMKMEPEPFNVIDFLVSKGHVSSLHKFAHVALKNGNHKTALHVLKIGNSASNDQVVRVLEEFTESNLESVLASEGFTCSSLSFNVIHAAAASSNSIYFAKILEKYPSFVYHTDEQGWYPFHYAAVCKSATNLDLLCNSVGSSLNYYVTRTEGLTALMVACKTNRVKNVQTLLNVTDSMQQQKLIESANLDGKTCAHLAAESGSLEVLEILLPLCFDIDITTGSKHGLLTALMLAASAGHFKCCELLVSRKSDVNLQDSVGRSALSHAIINGFQNIASLLICSGANPTIVDVNGNSLVHYASCYGWSHCLMLLIDIGLSLSLPVNHDGLNAMFASVLKGNFALATRLLYSKEVDINAKCAPFSRTILQVVCASEKNVRIIKETVAFLIKLAVKPNCKLLDSSNLSAPHLIAQKSELNNEEKSVTVDVAKLILEGGADLNMSSYSPFVDPPLSFALSSGNVPLAKLFLENSRTFLSGAELENGTNVLHLIMQHACVANVEELLLKIPSNLCANEDFSKQVANNGRTPLGEFLNCLKANAENFEKFEQGLKTLIQYLVTFSKCNILIGKDGLDALQRACEISSLGSLKQSTSLVKTLLENDVSPNEKLNGVNALHVALAHNCPLSVVELVATHTADLNMQVTKNSKLGSNFDHMTPVMMACRIENVDILELLLTKSVDLNIRTERLQKSVLHVLVENIQTAKGLTCLEKLIAKVADLNIVDKEGESVLHYAVRLNLALTVDSCKMLLKAGCSALIQNSEGKTPLHVLFSCNREDENESALSSTTFDPLELLLLFLENSSANFAPMDRNGCTVMHYIAGKGSSLCAQVIKDLDIAHPPDVHGNTVLCYALINRKEDCAIGILNSDLNLDLTKLYAYIPTSLDSNPDVVPSLSKSECGLRKISAFSLIAHFNMWRLFFLAVKRFAATATNSYFLSQIIRSGQMKAAAVFLNNMHPESLVPAADTGLTQFHDMSLAYFQSSSANQTSDLIEQLYAKSVKVLNEDKPNNVLCFHYAAYSANVLLLKSLLEKLDCEKVAFAKDDFSRTVLAAALMSGDLETVKLCYEKFSTSKLTDIMIRFGPVRDVSKTVYEAYNSDSEISLCTPLIYSIQKIEDCSVLKFLVSTGSFDLNKCDENKKSPIMHAVASGNLDKVNCLLEKNSASAGNLETNICSKIDLATVDSQGQCVAHCAVQAAINLGVENVDIVDCLILNGVNFNEVSDGFSKTAYQLALDNKFYKLADRMRIGNRCMVPKDLKPPELPKVEMKDPLAINESPVDFAAISADMFEKFKTTFSRQDFVAEIDKHVVASVGSKAEVVVDNGFPMDARLIRVETGEAPNPRVVCFYFYKMQLVHAPSRNGYYLHINSGLVGKQEPTQVQSQLIQSLEQAKKEFSRLFKTKTDNLWDAYREQKFVLKPRKYTVLKSDYCRKVNVEPISDELSALATVTVESEIEKSKPVIFQLVEEVLSQTVLSLDFLSTSDSDLADFRFELCSTSDGIIDKLKNEMSSMQSLVDELEVQLSLKSPNWSQVLTTSHKMNTLSNEIYYSLPVSFDPCSFQPFYTKKGIKLLAVIIESIRNFHKYSQVLLSSMAKMQSEKIHPVDFVLKNLSLQIVPLPQDDVVVEMLNQCVNKVCKTHRMKQLFAVNSTQSKSLIVENEKEKEQSDLEQYKNHMLLWYPMRHRNVMSLLTEGVTRIVAQEPFRLNEPSAQFTDCSLEALKKAVPIKESLYMVLCHVNLGRMMHQPEKTSYHEFVKPPNVDSIYCSNSTSELVLEISEQTIPGGVRFRDVKLKDDLSSKVDRMQFFSEYAVFDCARVKLAYLVRLEKV